MKNGSFRLKNAKLFRKEFPYFAFYNLHFTICNDIWQLFLTVEQLWLDYVKTSPNEKDANSCIRGV